MPDTKECIRYASTSMEFQNRQNALYRLRTCPWWLRMGTSGTRALGEVFYLDCGGGDTGIDRPLPKLINYMLEADEFYYV